MQKRRHNYEARKATQKDLERQGDLRSWAPMIADEISTKPAGPAAARRRLPKSIVEAEAHEADGGQKDGSEQHVPVGDVQPENVEIEAPDADDAPAVQPRKRRRRQHVQESTVLGVIVTWVPVSRLRKIHSPVYKWRYNART